MSTKRCTIFILLWVCGLANGQSQSSCLVQARLENAKLNASGNEGSVSPFSVQQQQCIEDYVQAVRIHIPSYDLSHRRFGGAAKPPPAAPPILGAGFGGTATQSVAVLGRQLGLKVSQRAHNFTELVKNCSDKQLNDVNFSHFLLSSGMDMLLHRPIPEFFLDFYAASPDSSVLLTLHDPMNQEPKHQERVTLQSFCSVTPLESLTAEALAQLMEYHQNLVRCMVPTKKLLEVNLSAANTTEIAQFLGRDIDYEVPMPQVVLRHDMRGESNDAHEPSEGSSFRRGGSRLPICITGQIRRLELQTKIQRLIQPAVDEGHRVQVYLVIDPRHETTYIHRAAGGHVGNYTIAEGNFQALEETVGLFPPNVSVIFDPFIPKDYAIDERYAFELMHGRGGQDVSLPPGSLDLAQERAKSHVRQWEALARCYQLFQVLEDAPPTVALRIRDDFAFVESFVPRRETLARGIHVPNCETNQGLNDKAALVSGAGEVEAYFTQPLSLMRQNFSAILALQHARKGGPMNPESVLFNAMTLSQVKQYLEDFPAYRVTMLREKQGGPTQSCYVAGAHHESCLSAEIWRGLKNRTVAVFAAENKDPQTRQPKYFCEQMGL